MDFRETQGAPEPSGVLQGVTGESRGAPRGVSEGIRGVTGDSGIPRDLRGVSRGSQRCLRRESQRRI